MNAVSHQVVIYSGSVREALLNIGYEFSGSVSLEYVLPVQR